jgi:hypothetical protein
VEAARRIIRVDLCAYFVNSRMDLLCREQNAYRIGRGDILCCGHVKPGVPGH